MTTTHDSPSSRSSTSKPLSAPPGLPVRSDGLKVAKWIEAACVYGEGDRFGQSVRLEPFQVHFLLHLYELNENGTRRYRRALFECPKGNGKTPLAAWVGAYELTHTTSPVIPVAAASYDQADLLFGDLRSCVAESPVLFTYLEPLESEVQVRSGPGRAYKVAAVAGTNDGQRPSCLLADEIHEWLGNKERVHLVLAHGCAKRAGSLQLNTTTPGADLDTMAGRLHDYGVRVNSGEIDDREFLFVWYGCPADRYDLEDQEQLRRAIREANPAADVFLNVEDVAARYHQVPRYEFLRYNLACWTTVGEAWLPDGAWDACADTGRTIAPGAEVVLGFDGSFNNDSTALVVVGCGETPHVDVVAAWERPRDARHDWQVPVLDVEDAIRTACKTWQVREIACDPFRWARTYQVLESEGLPVVEFPQSPSRMTPATQRFYEAVVNNTITHSGDPRLARHLSNCVLKVDARGSRLAKESKASPRKIDLAVAAVMAYDRACQIPERIPPVRVVSLADALAAADA
jgi:phage terminase large subunit-like protein